MKIIIDADGCPVVYETIEVAKNYGVETLIISDTAHHFNIEGISSIIVDRGADAVDFEVIRHLNQHDLVVTQDYGLAAMVLAKKGYAMSQNGLLYHDQNIEALLLSRHHSQKMRKAKIRVKGPKKRTAIDNERYKEALGQWLGTILSN